MIKSQKKLIIFVSAFFIIIFIIIAARYFVGQYFQKKFRANAHDNEQAKEVFCN